MKKSTIITTLTILLLLLIARAAYGTHRHEGFLSAYSQRPTDATLEYRQEIGQIPLDISDYDGLIAVLNCARIGESATLHINRSEFDVLIFDCAGVADGGAAWMCDGKYVAEMGYYLWQQNPHLLGQWGTIEFVDGIQPGDTCSPKHYHHSPHKRKGKRK